MMDKHIESPFTEDQVKNLNEYQVSGLMHPFTCGNGGHDHGVLIAKGDGWHCHKCEYTQNWAYDWMTHWQWIDVKIHKRI